MAENHPRERHGERSDLARFYAAALADQVSRGMSVADYAEEIGVTAATLYSWRRRLRATPGEVAPCSDPLGLIEVKVSRSSSTPSDSGFVVRVASGREVRIPEGFDAASLRRLLEVLESC